MLATKRRQWYTVSQMKRAGSQPTGTSRKGSNVSEFIWETFDDLFKTVHRQGRRVEELEARVIDLEKRLNERAIAAAQKPQALQHNSINEMPAERAA